MPTKVRGASVSRDFNTSDRHLRLSEPSEHQEHNFKQLQHLIQRIRPASSSASHVDSAYKDFDKYKETCSSLCVGILQDDGRPSRNMPSTPESTAQRNSSAADSPHSSGGTAFDQRSSFSGRSMGELVNDAVSFSKGPAHDMYLNAMRDWRACLEALCEALRSSLGDTYKSYERDATPEMLDLLFTSKKFRREAVHRMRNASVTRMLSADPQFFPRYEIRFRNYERAKKELIEVRQLLQSAESGIPPTREVQEFIMSPRGDAVLEFANFGSETSSPDPVLRFRVSSSMLANTSPIFARMFSGHPGSFYVHEAEDIQPYLPRPPTAYMCQDGTEVKLYRMPQYETNRLHSFEMLMHAAHLHTERMPDKVSFEQFVAIAECSLRYKSTSPLELLVEERWLPQWLHRGADDMPDGLLVISYAFGLRQLFTRISKRAILNITDEKDLQAKPWPQNIKDKIWAVRCAKLDQIYACCTSAIQEYIRQPAPNMAARGHDHSHSHVAISSQTCQGPLAHATTLRSSPRCPKGSHGCDAANLGWILLNFNEMHLLQQILQPSVMSHISKSEQPPRSLAHTVEILRMMPSPASPVHHGGVCDPSLSFRTAIADIYSSVTGLTLYDISGKSHGWALSKHQMAKPQTPEATGLGRMAAGYDNYTVASEFPDSVRLQILTEVDDPRDLRAAAQVNKGFFQTYKTHEVRLLRKFLQLGHHMRRGATGDNPDRGGSADPEPKIRTQDFAEFRNQPARPGDGVSVISFDTNDDEEEEEDDLYGLDAPETPLSSSIIRPSGRPDVDPLAYSEEEARSPADAASPTTPRQAPADHQPPSTHPPTSKPLDPVTLQVDEPAMTDEEARRILWPDPIAPDPPPPPIRLSLPSREGGGGQHREKFLAGDALLFAHGLEDKTLVVTGDKQLRSELDRRKGLLKKGSGDEDGGGRSGSVSDGGVSRRGS
ncbi:hypothetical protein E4U41_005710 [Claviceps citrina]|nr:hypothetical protein E4U41_005710 [Claviceps citrina]